MIKSEQIISSSIIKASIFENSTYSSLYFDAFPPQLYKEQCSILESRLTKLRRVLEKKHQNINLNK